MSAPMELYRIVVRGKIVGAEFGTSPRHAIARYAEGSTYSADEMTALLGGSGLPGRRLVQ